jgi:hypothetical protein
VGSGDLLFHIEVVLAEALVAGHCGPQAFTQFSGFAIDGEFHLGSEWQSRVVVSDKGINVLRHQVGEARTVASLCESSVGGKGGRRDTAHQDEGLQAAAANLQKHGYLRFYWSSCGRVIMLEKTEQTP